LALGGSRVAFAKSSVLPSPATSGIDHVIVVMMENRSYDHFLGWVPQSDGQQAGLTYPDAAGVAHATHQLSPDFQGCGHPDPDHSFQGGRVEYNLGQCDGWLRAGENDDYAIGYYTNRDLPFFAGAVTDWTARDANSANLAEILDFDKPKRNAPRYRVAAVSIPDGVFAR